MRMAMLGLAAALLSLAGCERKAGKEEGGAETASLKVGEDGDAAITAQEGAARASLSIPGIELGGDDMNIDGIRLYPGSRLRGIDVTHGDGSGKGLADMRFTSPAAPVKVAAHFAAAARERNFSDIKVTTAGGQATLTAKKDDGGDLTITMEPAEGGTSGRILVRDDVKGHGRRTLAPHRPSR